MSSRPGGSIDDAFHWELYSLGDGICQVDDTVWIYFLIGTSFFL